MVIPCSWHPYSWCLYIYIYIYGYTYAPAKKIDTYILIISIYKFSLSLELYLSNISDPLRETSKLKTEYYLSLNRHYSFPISFHPRNVKFYPRTNKAGRLIPPKAPRKISGQGIFRHCPWISALGSGNWRKIRMILDDLPSGKHIFATENLHLSLVNTASYVSLKKCGWYSFLLLIWFS